MRIIALMLTLLVLGCAGTKGTHDAYKEIRYPDGSTFILDTRSKGETISPSNAATPSTLSVTDSGIVGQAANVLAKTVDQITAEGNWIYSLGAVLCLVGAGLAIWKGKYALAAGVGLAGLAIGAFPFVAAKVGTVLLISTVIAVGGGAFWMWWTWRSKTDAVDKEREATIEQAMDSYLVQDYRTAMDKMLTLPLTREIAKRRGVLDK